MAYSWQKNPREFAAEVIIRFAEYGDMLEKMPLAVDYVKPMAEAIVALGKELDAAHEQARRATEHANALAHERDAAIEQVARVYECRGCMEPVRVDGVRCSKCVANDQRVEYDLHRAAAGERVLNVLVEHACDDLDDPKILDEIVVAAMGGRP